MQSTQLYFYKQKLNKIERKIMMNTHSIPLQKSKNKKITLLPPLTLTPYLVSNFSFNLPILISPCS